MRPEANAAPVHRRLLAGTVDALLAFSIVASTVAAVLRWRFADESRQRRLKRLTDGLAQPRVQHTVNVGSRIAAVALRHRRSPGLRVAGLRKVDARTGGTVTLRTSTTAQLWYLIWGQLFRRFWIPRVQGGDRGGCLLAIALLALNGAGALLPRRGRTIDDRITGVVVVRDRR